jgi:histidyl-tRNA synthetase
MHAQILVQATPQQPVTHMPDMPATGWGIAGAALMLILQKGFEVFSQKEKQESDLVTKLVESLQDGQEKLLDQLVVAQKDHHQALVKLEVAINNFSEAVNTSFEIHDRKIASLEQEVQQLRALSCPLPILKK